MYYLNLDEDSHLLSINEIPNSDTEADINLADYDFSGYRINAYKWENGELILDEVRLAELEQSEAEETPTKTDSERIAELEEALNLLLSGDTE